MWGVFVILMLFAVMLTGNRNEQRQKASRTLLSPLMGDKRTIILGVATAVVFLLSVGSILWEVFNRSGKNTALPPMRSTVDEIGTLLLTDHILAFEMSSVLLLGALIGATIIARPKVLETGEAVRPSNQDSVKSRE